MIYDYFVETGNRGSYLAFDAPSKDVVLISTLLDRLGMLPLNAEIRESIRPAKNGKLYKYYTRLKNLSQVATISSFFERLAQPANSTYEAGREGQDRQKLKCRIAELERIRLTKDEELRELELRGDLLSLSVRILRANPFTPAANHILRPEMLEALISAKPQEKAEFGERINPRLRDATSNEEASEFLGEILDTIHRIENTI